MDFNKYNDNILNDLNDLMGAANPIVPTKFTPIDGNKIVNQIKKLGLSKIKKDKPEPNNRFKDITEEQLMQWLTPNHKNIGEGDPTKQQKYFRDYINSEYLNDSIVDNPAKYPVTESENGFTDENNQAMYDLQSWDPRLRRLDAFYMNAEGGSTAIVPFASNTAATAFSNMIYRLPLKVARELFSQGNNKDNDRLAEIDSLLEYGKHSAASNARSEYPITPRKFYNTDSRFWGASSLMNPYSLTRLVGSFANIKDEVGSTPRNYMYDIRDSRRYYGITDSTEHPTQVLSPTVSHIIEWANKDRWGRTPYTYQDFVYCKYFGLIPNNRLITLRRYHAPTRDNLQFEQMYGDSNKKNEQMSSPSGNHNGIYFAPRCTVVTYAGDDTGNKFSELLSFSTGINWIDAKSEIWEVSGDDGDDPQATIDSMFEGGGFGQGSKTYINGLMNLGSMVTNKIMSFGKMATAINGTVTASQGAGDKRLAAQMDPYNDGTYANRIQGPLNRIEEIKRRKEGIIFDQSFTIKCEYVTKSIGGINPKAAMLDILSNCMEMVSPTAVFWGGGHRFMMTPHFYPFHDGSWRDNFMKKLYDGKIFGHGGAMEYVLSGVRRFGTKNGEFSWDNIMTSFGNILGTGLACISSIVSSVSSALFGEGTNVFTQLLDKGAGASSQGGVKAAKMKANNMFKNLNNMWRNKVLATSIAPTIKNMHALLTGDPVGEWHLTVGNPLNPIMVVGNLICEKMQVQWNDELGPDDFPTGLTVTYTLQHGMKRDKPAIQSMFNRGMGAIYELPDYIKSSSEYETHVDKTTGGTAFRQPAFIHANRIKGENGVHRFMTHQYRVSGGHIPSNTGNYNTQIVTKFNGDALSYANTPVSELTRQSYMTNNVVPAIKAMAITRKYTS